MKQASPLRYPGGKWRFAAYFERLLALNFDTPPTYVEPYCGGGSLALSLLFSGSVSEIFLNDLDVRVYSFWKAATTESEKLAKMVESAELSVEEWLRQRDICHGNGSNLLELGFATFYLNRTNHSGILNGGLIGGLGQSGDWRMNARFNRADLADRIRRIGTFSSKISISQVDATTEFASIARGRARRLFYLDPPYVAKGRDLYLNALKDSDHELVCRSVRKLRSPWVVSYDNVKSVRELYGGCKCRKITLLHTARTPRIGEEIMFFSDRLRVPRVAA